MRNPKVLYISNVNLEGRFLPGVIHKIRGQEKAFRDQGFTIDLLYPGFDNKIVHAKGNVEKKRYPGSREEYKEGSFLSKFAYHYRVNRYGSIDFTFCSGDIIKEGYDAVYLRFFLPGKDLVSFLEELKRHSPHTLILLEYPTLNIRELFSRGVVRKIAYRMNRRKIDRLNQLADYIITLTKDAQLFGKPAIFMANGIELDTIIPVSVPAASDPINLLGVASDCAFYHGFDKIIRGMSRYRQQGNPPAVHFRIVSNMLSNHLADLKKLAIELKVDDWMEFQPTLSREELAVVYGKVHMGVGTLALHRVNLMNNYSLKHREYAAFGLPFIMSRGDEHFENSPFVYTVERDEEPVDITGLVRFYRELRDRYPDYPRVFRKSMENSISWEAQLEKVFAVIKKKQTAAAFQ